ncbi:MAG: DNA cytosine methyltransferase [Acidimicrobiales bacterium]|nr:DNA cytosine methyltransferase [Acidimicrobiales bacterium]
MPNALTFVDLFSGAGGLSLGLTDAGWRCELAADLWADAIATHAQNLDHPAVLADVAELGGASLPSATWVVGGPPCQGYSTVGRRDRSDPRNRMFLEFRRIVVELKPEGFVLENVLGLKDMRFVEEVKQAFAAHGYFVTSTVLRSADHGVPQLRRRVVFVGHRERGFFQGVPATHGADRYVTVMDAIGDLPAVGPGETVDQYDQEPQNEFQTWLRKDSTLLTGHTCSAHPPRLVEAISHIPDGGNRTHIPPHLQPRSGYHNSYSRLSSSAPAVAVTSNMGKPSATRCIHPFQDRGLTAREGARLQTFPDTFHFEGGITSQRLQVANAVPPLLARRLGEALEDPLLWGDREPLIDRSAQ